MNSQTEFRPNYAVSPGEVLDEHRVVAGLTQSELAQRLGFSGKHVNRIIAGFEPVTPETALKLESVFGLSAGVWLNLEAKYQEHQARQSEVARLEAEQAWLSKIPHRSIAKLGWIPERQKGNDLVRSLRSFFGVGSLDYLPTVWHDTQAAYRKSEAFSSHEWAMLAWLAQGERAFDRIVTKPFDSAGLRTALSEIKALSCLPDAKFAQPLVERCASLGVALVFVPTPEGARVCGATRWMAADKVLVQLSLRYRTNDQFWFTLFHEFGHVLLHGKKEPFIDFDGPDETQGQEREANDFATRQLVNQGELDHFVAEADFRASRVREFAAEQRVAPGIVVGQLQHRRVVPYKSALSRLKESFTIEP